MAVTLAPAYAIAILLAGGPDDGCPSPRQLADSLGAHLPGMVLPLGHATGPTTLRLTVATDAAGAMRLDLADPEGGPLLHRSLPAPEKRYAGDCPALAETAALIVDRYWHEVGYDVPAAEAPMPPKAPPPPPAPKLTPPPPPAPPPAAESPSPPARGPPPPATPAPVAEAPAPPSEPAALLPPPRWWIGIGAAARFPDSGSRIAAASLAVAVERPVFGRPIGLRLSAGVATELSAEVSTGQATLRQFPVRMGGYLPFGIGFGRLEPGLGVDLDVLSIAFSGGPGAGTRLRASPGADIALAWALPMPHDIFARVMTDAEIGVPYRVIIASNDATIFTTPRLVLAVGIEFGFWFP